MKKFGGTSHHFVGMNNCVFVPYINNIKMAIGTRTTPAAHYGHHISRSTQHDGIARQMDDAPHVPPLALENNKVAARKAVTNHAVHQYPVAFSQHRTEVGRYSV